MSIWRGARGTGRRLAVVLTCVVAVAAGQSSAVAEPTPAPASDPTSTATAVGAVTVTARTAETKVVRAVTNVWGTATGAPNAPVSVQALVNGVWSTSQTGTTDANGAYVLPLTYGASTPGTHTFRVAVTVSGTRYYSPSVTLTRTAPAVTVTAKTAGTKVIRAASNIWGTATGAPNAPVSVQALVGGKWSTSRSGTTDSRGYYVLPLTYGASTPGTHTFRVVVTAGIRYYSPTVTLTRTAPAVTVTAKTAGTKVVRALTNVWGTATGAPNAPVSVQALVGGKWSTSQTRATDARGYYGIPLTYGASTPGTHTFRVVVTVAGKRYVSPTVTLTRTGKLDPRCYTSGVVLCASKQDRKVYYVNRGKIVRTLDARFGGRAYDVNGRQRIYSTAEGTFYVTRKVRNEISYLYDNTPMPFTVYFFGGQGFHYSYGFAREGWVGDWGRHGCVNLRSWTGAEWLFNNTKVGTKVVIYR